MNRCPEIESYLRSNAGLDPDATPGMVSRAVDRILAEKQITDPSEYLQLLKGSDSELETLLEQVLVPETWFFRYPESFHLLRRYAAEQSRQIKVSHQKLRILSVPCSSGEEPYSIAITLLEAGLQPEQFLIDAADLSKRSLMKAKSAIYSENSFRGQDLLYRDRYFHMEAGLFRLNERLRKLVKYSLWNVLKEPPKEIKSRYDIIFCRNLFIYFHPAAQTRMKGVLSQLLAPNGLLFAGHAEAGLLLNPEFRPVPPMKAFAHRKQ